jgi:putative membrane protein
MNALLKIMSTVLDEGHMDGDHMMGWASGWSMWFWWLLLWIILIVIAFLVYRDAEQRGMNGLLWFVLVIIPWIGIFFLILYLIIRDEKVHDRNFKKSSDIILDERYARGEISRKEYFIKKEDMKKFVGQ